MRLITLVVLFLLGSNIAHAANVVTSDVTNTGKDKKWHILMDANHQPAMRDDQFSYTDFTFFFDYQLDRNNSFRILQAPTKLYEVAPNESEFTASDTILYHFWNTQQTLGTFKLRLVSAVNLPTAEDSVRNDKILTVTETLQANTMLRGNVLLSLRPFMRYNWYEFKTTKSGTPLPAFTGGLNLVSSYQMTNKFSINASAGYSFVTNYASQFEESTAGIDTSAQVEGRYSFSLGGNYELTDKFSLYGSYSQGDIYIKDGRYEVYAYDPQISRFGIGATVYF